MSMFLTAPIGDDGKHTEPVPLLDVAEERAKLPKIEQVAIALSLVDPSLWVGEDSADYYRRAARAAIEAMREPMAKMVDAGGEAIYELNGDPTPDVEAWAQTAWSAMIDAALAEK